MGHPKKSLAKLGYPYCIGTWVHRHDLDQVEAARDRR